MRALAERFVAGGRLLIVGNGGSACDAAHVAVEFVHPILERRRALPAIALTADTAMITAVGNDSDFSYVFEQQIELLARPDDAVLGISTSGASANVNRALLCARRKGLLTIGFAGRDGGRMVEACDHAFVVKSWAIHRMQETHTLLLHLLWDLGPRGDGRTTMSSDLVSGAAGSSVPCPSRAPSRSCLGMAREGS